jgi:hypothetical protein
MERGASENPFWADRTTQKDMAKPPGAYFAIRPGKLSRHQIYLCKILGSAVQKKGCVNTIVMV